MKAARIKSSAVKNILSIVGFLLFAMVAFWLTGFKKTELFYRGQELGLFLFDKYYFLDLIHLPGGLLEYTGSFLTQFFYYPILGAVLMTVILLLVQWSVFRTLRLSKDYFLLSFLPSCFLLLFVTNLDYSIYVLKIQDIFYSQILGFWFALLPLSWHHKTSDKPKVFQYALMLFYLAFGYPLAGAYALLGILFLLVRTSSLRELTIKAKLALIVPGLLFVLLIPPVYSLFYTNLNSSFLYAYGFPVYDFYGSASLLIPLLTALFLPVVLILICSRPQKELKMPAFLAIFGILLLALSSVVVFTNDDQNLETQLAMENAISRDDWDNVLTLAKENSEDPNRILVLYRNLALWKKQQLCQCMFLFPQADAPLNTSNKFANQTRIAAQTVTLYFGMVNYCYRWNMENAVSFGFSVHNLKYMLRASVLNREEQLARKYAHILSKTLFYKQWAQDELVFLKNPRKMKEHPVYADILALRAFNNSFTADIEVMESAIHDHFINIRPNSLPLMELKMSSILTTMAVPTFWEAFFKYMDSGWDLPVHVQEVALMIGHVEQRDMPQILDLFNPEILSHYQEFTLAMNSFKHLAKTDQARLLKKSFGNTAWYYFYYTPRFKTN